MLHTDIVQCVPTVLLDKPRCDLPNMNALDWVCLDIRSEDIVFISVPFFTVFSGVGHIIIGYVMKYVMTPSHVFIGNNNVSVLHCVTVCIIWPPFWLTNMMENFI